MTDGFVHNSLYSSVAQQGDTVARFSVAVVAFIAVHSLKRLSISLSGINSVLGTQR